MPDRDGPDTLTPMRIKALALILCVVALAACGSDSDDSTGGDSTSSVPASCPFDGATTPQKQEGVAGSTTVNAVTPARDGCVDSITFEFAPTLPPAEGAYEGDALVITLTGAALGGSVKAGETGTGNLAYVQGIDIAPSGSDVKVSITLDQQRDFLLNSSKVPAELELSIG